jgi:hypothetical protein
VTPENPVRVDALVETMAARLRPLCADWPEDAFNEMVRSLAEITVKYEGVATGGVYDRRTTDRLVEEMRATLLRSVAVREQDPDQSKDGANT